MGFQAIRFLRIWELCAIKHSTFGFISTFKADYFDLRIAPFDKPLSKLFLKNSG